MKMVVYRMKSFEIWGDFSMEHRAYMATRNNGFKKTKRKNNDRPTQYIKWSNYYRFNLPMRRSPIFSVCVHA